MDALFESLSQISVLLLPTLGALVLIFLLVLLKSLNDLVKKTHQTVNHLDQTMNIVDRTLEDLRVPVQTIANVAHGIDTVTSITQNSALAFSKYLVENLDVIKEWIQKLFKRNKPTEQTYNGEDTEDIL